MVIKRSGVLAAARGCPGGGLTGCVPTSGPSALAVMSGDSTTRPYEVIDIDPSAIEVLGRRPSTSFAARFGDHRYSNEPVIGIGDMITVTIWEASSGGLFSSPAALEKLSAGANSATIPEQVVGRDGSITVPYAGRVDGRGQDHAGRAGGHPALAGGQGDPAAGAGQRQQADRQHGLDRRRGHREPRSVSRSASRATGCWT